MITKLNDTQLNWILKVKQDQVWCRLYRASAGLLFQIHQKGFYNEIDAKLINENIGPNYISYLKSKE